MSQPSENRLITSARYALCLLTASGVLLSGCASSGVGSVAQTTRAGLPVLLRAGVAPAQHR